MLKAFDDYWLRWIKLRLILRREENRRTRKKNPRSTGETNSHEFFENQHEAIPKVVTHSSGLNLEFSGERQRASYNCICHPCLCLFLIIPTLNLLACKAPYTRKRFPAFLYCSLFSRESRTTSSLLETIQKRRKTFPCVGDLSDRS